MTEEQLDTSTERYKHLMRTIYNVFKSEEGKKALDGLEQLFLHSYFDANCPSERAIYQQGQASVIYEIKYMIRQIETNSNLL